MTFGLHFITLELRFYEIWSLPASSQKLLFMLILYGFQPSRFFPFSIINLFHLPVLLHHFREVHVTTFWEHTMKEKISECQVSARMIKIPKTLKCNVTNLKLPRLLSNYFKYVGITSYFDPSLTLNIPCDGDFFTHYSNALHRRCFVGVTWLSHDLGYRSSETTNLIPIVVLRKRARQLSSRDTVHLSPTFITFITVQNILKWAESATKAFWPVTSNCVFDPLNSVDYYYNR